jgi:dextransucrase
MNYSQEKHLHYKMYKAGKNWVTAAIVVTALGASAYMGGTVAHADSQSQTNTTQATSASTASNSTNESTKSQTTPNPNAANGQGTNTGAGANNTKTTQEVKNSSATVSTVTPGEADANKSTATKDNNASKVVTKLDNTQNTATTPAKTNKVVVKHFTAKQKHQFAVNNTPVKWSKKYVTNIKGYLTANSWYQPKKILKNGTTWKKSTKKDYRPLLTAWWPNKSIQAEYVNYFNKVTHINDNEVYTEKSSASSLADATYNVQKQIEKRISTDKNTKWLNTTLNTFIRKQSMWNMSSEYPIYGWGNLQGGSFKYVNSKRTPWDNSKYRLIGRAYTKQKVANTDNYELLLANDIDNSNPTVQAEDLNNFYYLMNISSILGKGASGNFDGGREDATGSMDYDVTQIIEKFQKARYKMNSDAVANAHLNLLEDGAPDSRVAAKNDGSMGLTHDMDNTNTLIYPFTLAPGKRSVLSDVTDKDWVDRRHDYTQNKVIPNYSFVNVHDGVQSLVGNVISSISKDNPNAPTKDVLEKAIQIYDQDKFATDKKYSQYNIPSAYAILLSNKDVVPRVYYGDLYQEGQQYMSTKSPYYDAITTMLKDRIKYVAGGQQMKMHGKDILSSVRFGKNNFKPTDKKSRLSGYATVTSTRTDLKLGKKVVSVYMGNAHRNQAYRPELLSTKDGLSVFHNDTEAKNYVLKTDNKGFLHLDSKLVYGVTNPSVSGALSTWVPVGASAKQDVRTAASTKKHKDGKTFHSNAALDSHVAYEGFSSFQPLADSNSNRTDVVIAKNAALFKELGITDFEFPGHYMPVKNDDSFVDTLEENGYAFSDRYNLGMDGQSTKYGTVDQLINANKALHKQGVHTLTDYVMNQLYDLNGKELTSVSRINGYGVDENGSHINNDLYVANTKSSKKDYQYKFGGKFLSMLKRKYPALFKEKQESNNQPMDTKHHIRIWSAKYMNGTSIQGKGMGYVLKHKNGTYFKIK